jgi:hypothetical protein
MNRSFLDSYHLKWIALITMFIDHSGVIILLPLLGQNHIIYILFRLIGRLAFPLFAFMVVEALHYSKNPLQYIQRLASMAIFIGVAITGLTFLNFDVFAGNIFIDLSLGALAIYLLSHRHGWVRFFSIFPFLYIALLEVFQVTIRAQFEYVNAIRADYGIYGFTLILGFFLAQKWLQWSRKRQGQELRPTDNWIFTQQAAMTSGFSLLVVNLAWYFLFLLNPSNSALSFMGAQSYAILTMFLIFRYSGKLGNAPRWFKAFTYAFYPFHFLVIYLIYEFVILFL